MKKYDTVIFDLDGTLLNTLDDLMDSVNFALKMNGFPFRTYEEVRSFVGNGVENLIKLCVPEGTNDTQVKHCLADFRLYYSDNVQNKTAPYMGVMGLLKQLYEENYKLAIISNKFDKAVKALNKIYFEEFIKVALGETENVPKKPAPDMMFSVLKELGSSTDKAVFVGDSEVDAKTAKNAGVTFVGVTWGFRDREVLEREGASHIINEPQELLGFMVNK